jgi:hypothetical protein
LKNGHIVLEGWSPRYHTGTTPHPAENAIFWPFLCGKHSIVGTAALSEEPFEDIFQK